MNGSINVLHKNKSIIILIAATLLTQYAHSETSSNVNLTNATKNNAKNSSLAEDENKNLRALQWRLGIPEQYWTSELKQIASLLDQGNLQQANIQLDSWLKADFSQAFNHLPIMNQIFVSYNGFELAQIYTKHLINYKNQNIDKHIYLLSLLNFENVAVRQVAINLMHYWWQADIKSLITWLKLTPSFNEDLLLEEFLKRLQPLIQHPEKLANVFLALNHSDNRRARFFNQIIEDWLTTDPSSAITYVQNHVLKREIDNQITDKAAVSISYFYNSQKNHQQALTWIDEVSDKRLKQLTVRDFSLGIQTYQQQQIFKKWFDQNPPFDPDLKREIDKHFTTIRNPTLLGQSNKQSAMEIPDD